MSLPISHREEYPVSTLGIETNPQSILIKGSLWTLQLAYSRLILKEYEVNSFVISSIIVKKYHLTPALKNDLTIDTDRFWVWVIDVNDTLSLYEFEPYPGADPVQTYYKLNLDTNVNDANAFIEAFDGIRVITLYNTNDLRAVIYENIRSIDPPVIENLTWSGTRLNEFSSIVGADKSKLQISFLDVLSPPNIFVESYLVNTPTNFTVNQVLNTNEVSLSWDTAINADMYRIDRDTNIAFPSPIQIDTAVLTYSDFVPASGTYYYRIRSFNTPLLLQSLWSSTETVTLTLPSLVADFSRSPTSGDANLLVQFTDLTTGDPISWNWDFGDGSAHSTEQNPVHVYTLAGLHTVSLTVGDGVVTNTTTRDIVVNMLANFIGYNTVGPANLTVNFTDTTLGDPTSWDWDFGDGSAHSTEQNPTHTYTDPGYFTVVLRASNSGLMDDDEIKTNFITVYTNSEFEATPRTGYSSLITQFVDRSTGAPTTWYWDFGDGSFSDEQNPIHHYTSPGEYTVTLTATSFFNSDSEIKNNYIIVAGTGTPDIAPEPDLMCYLSSKVEATRNVIGIRIYYKNNHN